MKLIEGKIVSAAVKERVKEEIERRGIEPCLAVILVGDDPASQIYVGNKQKACAAVGIRSLKYKLPKETTQEELLSLVDRLNADKSIHGILCQLPLPKPLDKRPVLARIDPKKDVDCFHPNNVGKLWSSGAAFLPCTPAGVIELLNYYNIDCTGKRCVILGRSNIVGKPMTALMLKKDATVTVCHSKTKDLPACLAEADILISAIGKPKFVTADMVKEGAVVIDVGISRLPNGKLSGDVDFEPVSQKASFITPVPGGCGPMTIAMLMKNTLVAYDLQQAK